VQEEVVAQKVIRIILVEDHADFRHLMASLLRREPDLELVAEVDSLEETHSHAAHVGFDVAILDLGLPDGNGTTGRRSHVARPRRLCHFVATRLIHPAGSKVRQFATTRFFSLQNQRI
jgi:DNA-binding NarL/FixJ family response regulator